jgi:hypothetical protein
MVAACVPAGASGCPWAGCASTRRPAGSGATLPYPLLILHSGNETFYYDDLAFNTMNFFEFISDRYANSSWSTISRGSSSTASRCSAD